MGNLSSDKLRQADWSVKASIVRWVDYEPQPGIVETQLHDRSGGVWTFITKFYDVSESDLAPESDYPLPGLIACVIVARDRDASGREFALVDTNAHKRGFVSEEGQTRFEVYTDQLTPTPMWQHWFPVGSVPTKR